jgi:uncharacterized protein YndB with AHSA1/START domain
MTEKNKSEATVLEKEMIITRVVNAPRELVWNAWVDPKQVVKWWGPKGFSTTIHEMDVREGGIWRHTMHGPNGMDFPNESHFVAVIKHEKIVYEHRGSKAGVKSDANFRSTWTFEDLGDKTRITLTNVFATPEALQHVIKTYGAVEGGKQTLGRLAEQLEKTSSKEFVITRVFDAPRELVFKAWTESEHIAKWFGPKGVTVKSAKMDLRPGGSLHSCMAAPDGHEMWGKWVFREIAPPEKLVYINSFSDEKGGLTRHPMSATWPLEMLTTVVFEDEGGKTKLTLTWVPMNSSAEEIATFENGMAGMTGGWSGTFDQLEAYLLEIK